ncbi:hypothetical protein B5M43_001725 [Microbacterium sp. MEC084]|uniref:DUF6226 family protein n=1 Tax=Microbacterium sp. MEC084 TaxID=1963027 RepID=UPI00106F476A|nr:DUF6226 family protein [Microbacterium sp. MEC084]MCD1267571.1 hypothetical protein [Microbacterium sp. MEC084]
MTGAGGYVRPPIAPAVFVDDLGRPYGERWGMVATPEDSCSVVSHPERSAPLHEVADALVYWLRATFDVQAEERAELAADLMHPQPSVLRAVRLTPAHPDAASLTFVWTDFPGVIVHAGLLHDFPYPTCGCDACDETWQTCADELEWLVAAVTAGGYAETLTDGAHAELWHRLATTDRRGSGGGPAGLDRDVLDAARPALERLPGGWAAWPRRPGTEDGAR